MISWVSSLPNSWLVQEGELARILELFHEKFPLYQERLRAISYWRLGTPYEIFNLGEEKEPDIDPLFRLDVSDCTSHILTTLALAESLSWIEAKNNLINIHYKPDEFGIKNAQYDKRWHFTSDRLLNHKMTPNVTEHYIASDLLKHASVHLNRKQDGTEFLDLNWSLPVSVSYIPNTLITTQLLDQLPEMVGVAFVKEAYFELGVVMAHEGVLIDGTKLLHAGQNAMETVIEDFMKYYFNESNSGKFDGIMFFDFKPMSEL